MLNKKGEFEVDIANRISAKLMNYRQASGLLCHQQLPLQLKGHFYKTTVMRTLLYGAVFWATKKQEVEVYVGW